MVSEAKKEASKRYYYKRKHHPEYIKNLPKLREYQKNKQRELRAKNKLEYKQKTRQQYLESKKFQGGLTITEGEFIVSFS